MITTELSRFLFGAGFHLLKEEFFERDFGLKVTLNSVNAEKLRSLDKSSYDHNPLNSRTQSPKEVTIFDLQIDDELDLVYAITGISAVPIFGSHVTGRDALTIATETTLEKLSSILKECLVRYTAKLPEEFEWMDNVHKVRDHEVLEICDLELNDVLKVIPNDSLYLGEPEIVNWENQIGYSFDCLSSTPRHVALNLQQFVDYIQNKNKPKKGEPTLPPIITTDLLRTNFVHVNDSEYKSIRSWTAYRCLYAEIKIGEHDYILRNGVWYKIASNFASSIDTYLKEHLKPYPHKLPPYTQDREDEYNQAVAASDPSFVCWDKNTVQMGRPIDKIELCDLSKDSTDLIHVKYYRSSQTLSHLYAQGFVSGHTFASDQGFRERMNLKMPTEMKLASPKERPDTSKYKIVYAIATTKALPDELPFFAKVSLKQAVKSLNTLGYQVFLARIDVDPTVLIKKKMKPKKAPRKKLT